MNGGTSESLELLESASASAPTDEDNEKSPGQPKRVLVDDVLDDIGCGLFQGIAFLLAGLAFFSYGCTAAVLTFINIPVSELWHLDALTYSIISGATCWSNTVGAVTFGFLGDRFGRVWPFALFMLVLGVFSIAAAFSPNFPVLVVLRAMGSVGTGGAQALTYPMLMEFLPIKNRSNTVLMMLMLALGSCLIAGLAWWLVPTYKDGWRYLLVASGIPPLLAAALRMIFYFQSPRFLISRGETAAAWKVLTAMAKVNRRKLNDTDKECLQEEEKKGSKDNVCKRFIYLFKPPLLRLTVLLMIVKLCARFAFYSTLLFMPVILEDLGVTIYFSMLFASIAQIPGILLMSIIMEWPWFGRLNTLRLYSLAAVVFYLLFAFIRNEIATSVLTVLIFFTMSPIVSMSYTYTSEVYPTEVRGIALGFLLSTQGIVGGGVRIFTGYIVDLSRRLPWLFPSVWGGLYLAILLVSFGLKQETRGKRLDDNLKRS